VIRAELIQRRRDFTLDVAFESAGPVLGVFGHSGSGKTTLLHALAGLTRSERARVHVKGEVLSERPGGVSLAPERRGLALVPQEPLLFPHLSIRENLTFARGAAREFAGEHGAKVLDVLRLRDLLDREPETLSGGEKQRVSLGRAWLSRPRMLLLDKPAASLDADLAREVVALLMHAKRELDVPMVFVTHRPSELIALADDCIVLEAGRIVAQGAPLEVLSKPKALGLARLVGIDNLMELAVVRHDAEAGLTLLDLGGGAELATPLCEVRAGATTSVGLYAEDIILCRELPGATSARNNLAGVVVAVDPIGHEVLVTLSVGRIELQARVTPGAARELGLEVGQPAFALIKTTACHHLH